MVRQTDDMHSQISRLMWSLSERWNDGEKMHEREIEPGPEHLFWWCRRNEYKNNKKRVKEKLIEKKWVEGLPAMQLINSFVGLDK